MRRRLPAGRVRIVAVDETWLRVRGKSRPAGVVVDLDGRMLGLELTGPGFDYGQWFQELAVYGAYAAHPGPVARPPETGLAPEVATFGGAFTGTLATDDLAPKGTRSTQYY